MRIIEIETLSNGAHRNQTGDLKAIPDGWAVIPDTLETKNFPFGVIVAEEINGVMTVTSWEDNPIPEEPIIEVPKRVTTEDILNTLLGVAENE